MQCSRALTTNNQPSNQQPGFPLTQPGIPPVSAGPSPPAPSTQNRQTTNNNDQDAVNNPWQMSSFSNNFQWPLNNQWNNVALWAAALPNSQRPDWTTLSTAFGNQRPMDTQSLSMFRSNYVSNGQYPDGSFQSSTVQRPFPGDMNSQFQGLELQPRPNTENPAENKRENQIPGAGFSSNRRSSNPNQFQLNSFPSSMNSPFQSGSWLYSGFQPNFPINQFPGMQMEQGQLTQQQFGNNMYDNQFQTGQRRNTQSQFPPNRNNQFPTNQNNQSPTNRNIQFPTTRNTQFTSNTDSQFLNNRNSQFPMNRNNQFPRAAIGPNPGSRNPSNMNRFSPRSPNSQTLNPPNKLQVGLNNPNQGFAFPPNQNIDTQNWFQPNYFPNNIDPRYQMFSLRPAEFQIQQNSPFNPPSNPVPSEPNEDTNLFSSIAFDLK